jgi:hypothetical protein
MRSATVASNEPGRTTATVGPTRFSTLLAMFLIGGMGGYAFVSLAKQLNGGMEPRVEWTAVGVLATIAALLLAFAYTTFRTVHRERRLIEARRAVNLLMFAKASALMGALFAGGYLGFALQFALDLEYPPQRERFVRGCVAAVTAVTIVISALLLERACRIPEVDDD